MSASFSAAFRAAAAKIRSLHQALRLLLNAAQNRRDGQTLLRGFQSAASEIGDGLNMNAPDVGGVFQGKAENIAQSLIVDSRRNRGHQNHRQSRRLAVFDGAKLRLGQRRPPEGLVDLVVQPVKLQEHRADPGFRQMFGVAFLPGNAKTVGVQLEEGEALFPAQGDDLVQIVFGRQTLSCVHRASR